MFLFLFILFLFKLLRCLKCDKNDIGNEGWFNAKTRKTRCDFRDCQYKRTITVKEVMNRLEMLSDMTARRYLQELATKVYLFECMEALKNFVLDFSMLYKYYIKTKMIYSPGMLSKIYNESRRKKRFLSVRKGTTLEFFARELPIDNIRA